MLIRGDGVGFQQYNLKRLPTVYFVDRKGNVVGREAGYQSYEQLEKSLQKALK